MVCVQALPPRRCCGGCHLSLEITGPPQSSSWGYSWLLSPPTPTSALLQGVAEWGRPAQLRNPVAGTREASLGAGA